jgi:hypothetical protein
VIVTTGISGASIGHHKGTAGICRVQSARIVALHDAVDSVVVDRYVGQVRASTLLIRRSSSSCIQVHYRPSWPLVLPLILCPDILLCRGRLLCLLMACPDAFTCIVCVPVAVAGSGQVALLVIITPIMSPSAGMNV